MREGHGCHTPTCPLTPAEMSVHVLRRRNCGLTRGQELCCLLPVITVAKIGAGQCHVPTGWVTLRCHTNPMPATHAHSRTQSGRGSVEGEPRDEDIASCMAKGEGATA